MSVDRYRDALQTAGKRRSKVEQERTSAHTALAKAVQAADKANVPKTEIARLAGVSRQTVHNILNR